MYYNDICDIIRKSEEKTFTCEMINGNIINLDLKVREDNFSPVPVYADTEDTVLPLYLARDILNVIPTSKYRK